MEDKQNKKETVKVKRKTPGVFEYMRRQSRMRRATNSSRAIRTGLAAILLLLFLIFLMSGIINQVQTGQSLIEWITNISKEIGNFIYQLFTGESNYFNVTEDGIYFK